MKKSFLGTIGICLIAMPLFMFSCKSDKPTAETTRKAVDPQLMEAIPFQDFNVDVSANDTIRLPEGTNIYIPTGTFVDEKGEPVSGRVQLHYRAFYSTGDIIASGITMQYDTAGQAHVFTSAGMFELTGTQDGKPISIAPKKSITMDFASTRNDMDFSFYKLDTSSVNWNFISTTKVENNKLRENILKELAGLITPKPVEPKAFDATKPVIDIDVEVTDHPELAGYNGIVWQFAGVGNDPEQNKWIYNTNWNSAKLVMNDTASCTYILSLSNKEKKFSTSVIPRFKEGDYTRAIANFKTRMGSFVAQQQIIEEKEVLVEKIPPFIRPVSLMNFGVHNCDQIFRFGRPAYVNAEFHFDDPEFETQRKNVTVYVISASGNLSMAYNALNQHNILYYTDNSNCMIAVLKGTKRACVLSVSDFKYAVEQNKSSLMHFKLQPSTEQIANGADLDRVLRTL